MKRVYVIRDGCGERRVGDEDMPLRIGGAGADVVVPGCAQPAAVAYVALSDGHAYLQAAHAAESDRGDDAGVEIFLNHERVVASVWLKSGDRIEIEDAVLTWTVLGDQVFLDVAARAEALVPPPEPPPAPAGEAGLPTVTSRTGPVAGRRLRRATKFGLALLALVALYFAVSSPIVLDIRPEPDERSVTGFPPPLPLLGRYLALPGSYELNAQREGYHPLEREIEVVFGTRVEAEFDMAELPGRIMLALEPVVEHPLLRMLVDGAEAARADDGGWEVARGSRRLRVETDRYLPREIDVEVEGFGRPQTVELVLRPAWAEVHFESTPSGADVAVDGRSIGATPLDAEIMRGEPTIVVSMRGRKPVTLAPAVEAGARLVFDDIVLDPLDGRLIITSKPESATITIDGVFAGVTPATVVVAPDVDHDVRVTEPGYLAARREVSVAPDEDLAVAIEMVAEYGTVFVSARPADAELVVDGRPSGTATRRLRLTTRQHELLVRKEGYQPKSVKVTPRAGVSQSVEVELVTEQAAARAQAPPRITTAGGQLLQRIRPAGEFMMGASRREPGRRSNESRRRVELTREFYIAETEVTNAQFRRFRSSHDSGVADGSALDADDMPVVGVSWDDAARYCNWLSVKDGLAPFYEEQGGRMLVRRQTFAGAAAGGDESVEVDDLGYRLPTEAEWAYLARVHGRQEAGRYAWEGGYPPGTAVGNYADASIADTLADTVPGYNDGYRGAAPVASFPAGPAGLYDLGGNVAEWTNDYYALYPGEDQSLVRDPTGPVDGEHHVVRGASWRHGAITEVRASYRDYSRGARSDLGFRIARYAQ